MKKFVLAVALLACAVGADAQMAANFERGFAPEKQYQFGGLDNINLFNGNLVVTIPIGGSYPVNALSYSLTLVYNSSVWDMKQVNPILNPGQTDPGMQSYGFPTARANAGLGWMLSLGRLFYRYDAENNRDGAVYEAPDGSEHVVSIDLGFNGVSKDSSYYKWDAATQTLYGPDGTKRTFYLDAALKSKNGYGWLKHLEDRYGNFVDVVERFDNADGMLSRWTITDSTGRQQLINFRNFDSSAPVSVVGGQVAEPNYKTVVDSVELVTAGGTATYTFLYGTPADVNATTPIAETSLGSATGWPATLNLPMLRGIALPDGSSYDVAYRDSSYSSPTSGVMSALTLPTRGTISWGYDSWVFPRSACGDVAWMTSTIGVVSRTFTSPSGVNLGTWGYHNALAPLRSDSPHGQCNNDIGSPVPLQFEDEVTTTVTRPDLTREVNHFSALTNVGSYDITPPASPPQFVAEYGAPACRLHPDATGHRALSVETFPCAQNSTCTSRRKYIDYVYDDTAFDTTGHITGQGLGFNPRIQSERIEYEDGLYAETNRSGLYQYGHYPQESTAGNFQGINSRITYTHYTPDDANWLLSLYDSTRVEENGHVARTEACFDGTTGFLKRTRVLASDTLNDADTTLRTPHDLITVYEDDGAGNVKRETYYGGDKPGQAVGTGSLCSATLPSIPDYDIHHAYSYGVRASSRYYAANGAPVSFKSLDRVIHPSGMMTVERDQAELATLYTYWPWGALKTVTPPGETAVSYTYTTASASGSQFTPAIVTVTRGNQEKSFAHDSLGRPWHEKVVMADGTSSVRVTTYDTSGRKAQVSEFETLTGTNQFAFQPQHLTKYAYDGFGRTVTVTSPDCKVVAAGAPPDCKATTFAYGGVATVTRTSLIATGVGAEPGIPVTETYDRQGRLIQVAEKSLAGSQSAVGTTYTYDVGNRLASATTMSQTRLFEYDNRGFLLRERSPEKGALGNGYIDHGAYDAYGVFGGAYDARGHALRIVDGANDLTYAYDAAERLVSIAETGGSHRVIKSFEYGSENAPNATCVVTGCDARNGKLTRAIRYNHDPVLGAISVTEEDHYAGVGGRPSSRDVTVGSVTGFEGATFTTQQTWNALGLPETTTYPPCPAQVTCSGVPARQATYGYTRGMLTYVSKADGSAYAGIAYLPNGMIGNVVHINGLNETTVPDPSGMPRPCAIFAYDNASGSLVNDPTADCGKRLAATSTVQWSTGKYEYDGSGNITRIGTKSYFYDAVNRLTSENDHRDTAESYYDYQATFEYDVYGNMTRRGYVRQSRNKCAFCDGTTFRMAMPIAVDAATNRLTGMGYDSSGNIVRNDAPTPAGTTYAWDAVDTMRSITSGAGEIRYLYDASDERIAIVTRPTGGTSTTRWTLRGLDNKLLRTFTSTTAGGSNWSWQEDQIWRGGLLLANESPSGTKHYALDHLGSPRAITGDGPAILGISEFTAFGSGGSSGAGALQFTGHERDDNAGSETLDYMHARYYSSSAARFLSVDTLRLDRALRQPQKWNRYAYTENNPLRMIDPDGRDGRDVVVLPVNVVFSTTDQDLRARAELSLQVATRFMAAAGIRLSVRRYEGSLQLENTTMSGTVSTKAGEKGFMSFARHERGLTVFVTDTGAMKKAGGLTVGTGGPSFIGGDTDNHTLTDELSHALGNNLGKKGDDVIAGVLANVLTDALTNYAEFRLGFDGDLGTFGVMLHENAEKLGCVNSDEACGGKPQ